MRERVEKMLREYPDLVQRRSCLAYELAHFRGVSVDEVIESMYTSRMGDDRVQTSGTSDKTAQIALAYQERREHFNRDWYEHVEKQLKDVSDKLLFLESAIRSLPANLSCVLWDMVICQMKWDAIKAKYRISHTTLFRQRRKAIRELEKLCAQRDNDLTSYMLE